MTTNTVKETVEGMLKISLKRQLGEDIAALVKDNCYEKNVRNLIKQYKKEISRIHSM